MTDQISPTGNLASVSTAALFAAAATGSVPTNTRATKVADTSPKAQAEPAAAKSTDSPGKAVEQINSHLQNAETQLRIQVDQGSGKTVYKVMDPVTGQVVLQVPSEQVLAMAHQLQTLDKQVGAPGVLLDQKS